ncbi:hypothetical protein NSPZN2_10670 [Nitrospira defluvii]|uniref:Uncharacterized protein n=1 Tax=Nitrospira defluvii TaxID=330214 RepID=A0ABM8QJ71_9BACT|nr:hypothetical protein NSPZN2_10670 [Nitrospira defluvii]
MLWVQSFFTVSFGQGSDVPGRVFPVHGTRGVSF